VKSPTASDVKAAFFSSRWVRTPEGVEELDPATLAPGFRAAGAACGIKGAGATDVALLACDSEEVRSALLLTRNAAAAAPVLVCRQESDPSAIRGAVVNSGNANAATGERGYRDALAMREAAAGALGLEPQTVAVAETGTIGVPLPVDDVIAGVGEAARALRGDGVEEFATAIMTTDRAPKLCSVRCAGVTVSAQAKGAGMIEPRLATMLCFVQTDAEIADPGKVLRAAAVDSFERITVDGQTSTNDTVLLQATGAAGKPLPDGLLDAVLLALALEIVADGEGATRVARVDVREAATDREADRVARAIANSPLVKASLHGCDPNWGRIAQAAGMALAGEEVPELDPTRIDAAELGDDSPEAQIEIRLGRGDASGHAYFCDLTPDYVHLNAGRTT
jgi:glutamate N-acetyltransferase / amino-acid N-acetyltransferase